MEFRDVEKQDWLSREWRPVSFQDLKRDDVWRYVDQRGREYKALENAKPCLPVGNFSVCSIPSHLADELPI